VDAGALRQAGLKKLLDMRVLAAAAAKVGTWLGCPVMERQPDDVGFDRDVSPYRECVYILYLLASRLLSHRSV
jgi:hypothetical protein